MTIQETGGTKKTVERASRRSARCSPPRTRFDARRCPPRTSPWVCSAAAPTATRASPPTQLSASPPTCWCARRDGHPVRDARDLRRRAPAHPPAVSREVGEKLIARIEWWEDYTKRTAVSMDNNPSPGNKAGGITTILEKSLGAAAKAGSTNLIDVFQYAEKITGKGFVFMDTPGYDPVSATGQVAGGANLDLLHHRPRLGVRLRASPVAQAGHQLTHVRAHDRRHGRQLRDDRRRKRDGRASGQRIFDLILRHGIGSTARAKRSVSAKPSSRHGNSAR